MKENLEAAVTNAKEAGLEEVSCPEVATAVAKLGAMAEESRLAARAAAEKELQSALKPGWWSSSVDVDRLVLPVLPPISRLLSSCCNCHCTD